MKSLLRRTLFGVPMSIILLAVVVAGSAFAGWMLVVHQGNGTLATASAGQARIDTVINFTQVGPGTCTPTRLSDTSYSVALDGWSLGSSCEIRLRVHDPDTANPAALYSSDTVMSGTALGALKIASDDCGAILNPASFVIYKYTIAADDAVIQPNSSLVFDLVTNWDETAYTCTP